MKINLRYSTIKPMIKLCKGYVNSHLDETLFKELLDHEDYQLEFRRYLTKNLPVANITRTEFEEYFRNIFNSEYTIINKRLIDKDTLWKKFFSDIDRFNANLESFLDISDSDISKIQDILSSSFPKKYLNELQEIDCVFTLSIGNSMGYPFENCIHFDYLNLELIQSKEEFIHFIAHEIHHIMYSRLLSTYINKPFTPLEYFLVLFSYEGLAVKFCNNGDGPFSKSLPKGTPNIGMISDLWNFYNEEFEEMFEQFKKDYNLIKSQNLSMDKVNEIINKKWATPDIRSFIDNRVFNGGHYRTYYLGMQLYGKIYDDYGLERLYDLLLRPQELVKTFEKDYL